MKNKHYGVLFIIYVLLFINLFFVFREKDISNFFNNFEYFQNDDNKNGFIYFESKYIEKRKVINKLKKLSYQENIAFIISNNIRENDVIIRFDNYYIGNEENLLKLLPKDSKIDFTNFNKGMFLSNKNNSNSQKLLTFYEVEYNIYPIEKALEDDFEINTIEFYHSKNESEVNYKIEEVMADFSIHIDKFDREDYNISSGLITNITRMLIIMIVISKVSSIFFISDNIKTIGVYRLNGLKKIDIWKKIYLKYLILSLVYATVIPIIGFLIIFNTVLGRATIPLLIIILTGILLSLTNLIVSIFFINLIYKIRLSELIKGRNINQKLTIMAYILVIVTGIIIVPVINENISKLSEGVSFLADKYFSIDDHSKYSTIDIDKHIESEEIKQKVINEINNIDALITFEPTSIFSLDLDREDRYLAFFVNEKYLIDQIFIFNHDTVDLFSEKDVIVLMDEKTFGLEKWSIEQFVFDGGKTAEIKLYDEVSFENYSDEMVYRYSNFKPIFIYNKENKIFNSQRLILHSNKLEKIKEIIYKNGITENIQIVNGKDSMNLIIKNALSYFGILIISIIPFLITFFIAAKSFYELAIITNKKKWTIKRIFGYSKLKVYLDVFIDFCIVCVALLLSRYVFSNISFNSVLTIIIILFINYIITLIKIRSIKFSKEVNHL